MIGGMTQEDTSSNAQVVRNIWGFSTRVESAHPATGEVLPVLRLDPSMPATRLLPDELPRLKVVVDDFTE